MSEAGGDETLKGEVVVSSVDDMRRDASPPPRFLQLQLAGPTTSPGDELHPVEKVEARVLHLADGAVTSGQHHPRVFQEGDGVNPLVRLGIEGESDIESTAAEPARYRLQLFDLAQDDLDIGMAVAKGPQSGWHELGGRGL